METVYSFRVLEEIKKGKTVYFIDYDSNKIIDCDEMKISDLLKEIEKEEKIREANLKKDKPTVTIFFTKGE